jgi:two-component system, NtrC family, sensor kinase
MKTSIPAPPHRILIVDDSRAIHEDFRKIFAASPGSRPASEDEVALFGAADPSPASATLELDFASQGEEALGKVRQAVAEDRPYAMAFMDVRMPPGWDGIETTARIWTVDPDLQVVVCTAYSDYSRDDMLQKLGRSDKLLILKKPFDNIEALQLATALTEKWQLTRQARRHVCELEEEVSRRTGQLRRSEDRYRLITENAGDLIAIVDDAGQWIYRSPSFQRLLGYSTDELDALGAFLLIHADDRPAAAAALRDCARRGVKATCEFRVGRKDGAWLTMESQAGPFRDAAGAVEGTLFVTRDITERRRLESQLRQAQKLESIGQLAAGIAHELNTPLQFIGDNTHFLEEAVTELEPLLQAYRDLLAAAGTGSIPPATLAAARAAEAAVSPDYLRAEIPRALRETLGGVERTIRIVQAMKIFSHPGDAERQLVDLRAAVESTLTISRSEWRRFADAVTVFDPELGPVPLFAAEFNQALLNLILNATHAIGDVVGDSGDRKGTLAIEVRRAGDWAEVRVRDTGIGIPAGVRDRIFDPFFTTRPPGKGTGQGLAIARSVIVGQHGGSLEFETTPGQGSVFIIRVPLHPATTAGPAGGLAPRPGCFPPCPLPIRRL